MELPPIPLGTLEKSTKEEFQTPTPSPPRHRTSSEYDHVLLNPLYAYKNRSRSNTIMSDQSSVFEDLGYAEVKGLARGSSSVEKILRLNSVPSDTFSQRSHLPRCSHSKTPSNLSLQPYLDDQGYAALEGGAHVYDEMHATHMYDDVATLSTSMKNNLVPSNELLLSASPYEMPAIQLATSATSNVIKGSLLSPEHRFGVARSNPNLTTTSPKRGFLVSSPGMGTLREGKSNPNITSHAEYRELEDIPTRMYDTPRNARSSIEGLDRVSHGYEEPVVVRETATIELTARDYESPVITVTGEGKHEYDTPDLAMEQRSMELETIPE